MGFWGFPLDLGFYVLWLSGFFWLNLTKSGFLTEALRYFTAFYNQFTDE